MARIIIIALPVAAGLWYTYRSRSPFTGIERTFSTAPTQDSSFAAHIINPRARPATREIFTYRLPIHHLKECVSEEEILARWCRGFFGGWTFTPERIFFKITGIAWTKFSGKFYVRTPDTQNLVPTSVWNTPELSRKKVPDLGSLLVDNFLVVDSSAASPEQRQNMYPSSLDRARPGSGAFIDFASGSDDSRFSVWNRFAVTCERDGAKENMVTLTYTQTLCNPTKGKSMVPEWFMPVHVLYAKMLFKDAIGEVLRD